jgi:hypothetical protein
MRSSTFLPILLAFTTVVAGCRKSERGGSGEATLPTAEGDAARPDRPDVAPDRAVVEPDDRPVEDGPTPTAATLEAPGGSGAASGFERHYRYEPPRYEVKAAAGALPISLDGVSIPPVLVNRYGLDDAARAKLSESGFVVVPAPWPIDEIHSVYQSLSGAAPVFVTADTALHLYHLVFDSLLMSIEQHHLIGMLGKLADALRAKAIETARGEDPTADAALDDVAVLDVIRRLLDPDAEVDPRVASRVAAEIGKIDARGGFARSPVFGYDEDYSQYVPRGHYT